MWKGSLHQRNHTKRHLFNDPQVVFLAPVVELLQAEHTSVEQLCDTAPVTVLQGKGYHFSLCFMAGGKKGHC